MRMHCHARKFMKNHYPNDESVKQAALVYHEVVEGMLEKFDSFKGKEGVG